MEKYTEEKAGWELLSNSGDVEVLMEEQFPIGSLQFAYLSTYHGRLADCSSTGGDTWTLVAIEGYEGGWMWWNIVEDGG